MINLIPPHARKAVTREYWIRVVTVWMFLVACSLVLIATLQAPTYVLINSLSAALEGQFNDARTKQGVFLESEAEILKTNALIDHLGQESEEGRFSNLIYELDNVAGNNVTISQFTFALQEDELGAIALIGNARTRIALSDFRDNLEEHPMFTAVELPISNLVKDRDITFSMKVSLSEMP